MGKIALFLLSGGPILARQARGEQHLRNVRRVGRRMASLASTRGGGFRVDRVRRLIGGSWIRAWRWWLGGWRGRPRLMETSSADATWLKLLWASVQVGGWDGFWSATRGGRAGGCRERHVVGSWASWARFGLGRVFGPRFGLFPSKSTLYSYFLQKYQLFFSFLFLNF